MISPTQAAAATCLFVLHHIQAIDAALPSDYEAVVSNKYSQSDRRKIAIVGFGSFGQFLSKAFVSEGHLLGLETTPINTKGYETLLNLVENTTNDSFDLYYGLFMHNKNSVEELERLELAFDALKKKLFGHSHDLMRSHLFGKPEKAEQRRDLTKLRRNDLALPSPSSDDVKSHND
uniref:Prephenate dehydrogenase n=1 Tax=Solanum tuberosum TaxID=4113 RepID=M1DQ74_SOLTU